MSREKRSPRTVDSEREALAYVTASGQGSSVRQALLAAVIVLSVIAVGVTVWALRLRQYQIEVESRAATLQTSIDSLSSIVATRDSTIAALVEPREFVAFLGSQGTAIIELMSAGDAWGRLMIPEDREPLLVSMGLRPLPADSTYQLWTTGPEGPRSIALLDGPHRGLVFATLEDAEVFVGVRTILVTAEPAAGSRRPTMPAALWNRDRLP